MPRAISSVARFLVAVAIGFLTLGRVIGKDLAPGTALICSSAVSACSRRLFRRRALSSRRLRHRLALLPGAADRPRPRADDRLLANEPGILTQAAGGTALTVLGMGALGFALSKDLARWMRPVSTLVLIAVAVSIVMLVVGVAASPLLSLVIYGLSAALILVNFNFLRKRASEDDVVWLATGIFVSIVNIFISLLNCSPRGRGRGPKGVCAHP